jgi:hypothetical protein
MHVKVDTAAVFTSHFGDTDVGSCRNVGRGVCRRGFCHCKAGWWGKDCGRSRAFGASYVHYCLRSPNAVSAGAWGVPARLLPLQARVVGQGLRAPSTLVQHMFSAGYCMYTQT